MRKIYFFGYGSYRSREKIREVIQRDPEGGHGAVLEGYKLAIQVLDQTPEKVRPTLERVWGKDFQAYTLRRGGGGVAGVVWELTEEDLAKIKEWEFVGSWREIITASVKIANGETISVVTEKVPDNQPIKELADGFNYRANLNREGRRDLKEFEEKDIELLRQLRRELSLFIQQKTPQIDYTPAFVH